MQEDKKESGLWELIKYAIIAIIIVVPFRIFIAQPYIVNGASMDPTFKDGDYLIVDQISKRFGDLERGAVVIIRYPKDPSKFFIKRLVAFPNEKIEIKDRKVRIYDNENPDGLILDDSYVAYKKIENLSFELG